MKVAQRSLATAGRGQIAQQLVQLHHRLVSFFLPKVLR